MKRADFAGAWYPDSRRECLEMIDEFRREIPERGAPSVGVVRGAVAPHAGWYFSGATAWSTLSVADVAHPEIVVIFGGHLGPHSPPSLMKTDGWILPVRSVECRCDLVDLIEVQAKFEVETDRRYRRDNGVELVMALAAAAFPEASMLSVGAPPTSDAAALGAAIGKALEDHRVLYVGSTDLTHYGPSYDFTPKGVGQKALDWATRENDAHFIARVTAADAAGAIESAAERHNACCPGAVAAAIAASRATAGIVTHATTSHARSGGSPVDFVGYAGMLLVT